MLKVQQLLNVTTFAVVFLLASLQLSITRFLQRGGFPRLADKTFKSGVIMIYAAMFDLFDGCLDEFIRRFGGELDFLGLTYSVHVLSTLMTAIAVILAIGSLDLFFRTLVKHPQLSGAGDAARPVKKIWPVGSREPAIRRNI